MLELGNWVRINIQLCDSLMECGHRKLHHDFNTRVGTLEVDFSIDHPNPSCVKRIRTCGECGYVSEDGATHYLGVCFDGEHQVFAPNELEDLGSLLPVDSVNHQESEPVSV